MKDFIEQQIIGAVKEMLENRVNELISELQFSIPLVEVGGYEGGSAVCPIISLATCERTEKERIIRLDTYSLTITFNLPEMPESELFCYAYSAAVGKAFSEDPTLGGVADRAVITGKKYVPPKNKNCGDSWSLVITLRLTVEGLNNAG